MFLDNSHKEHSHTCAKTSGCFSCVYQVGRYKKDTKTVARTHNPSVSSVASRVLLSNSHLLTNTLLEESVDVC